MHPDHDVFVTAIQTTVKVRVEFLSKEDGAILSRLCAPLDFGPRRRSKDRSDCYHLWDHESDKGPHVLSILPAQVARMILTGETFDPASLVTWQPDWYLARDWGVYS